MTVSPLEATITQRGIVVTPAERVLVVERASDGGWELPGGRLDPGEGAREGLRRELHEEVRLEPVIVEPVHTITWVNDDGDGRYGVYYYCRATRRDVALSEEHNAAAWPAATDVGTRLSEAQTTAVERALARHRATSETEGRVGVSGRAGEADSVK